MNTKIRMGLWLGVAGVCLALIGAWIYQASTRLGTPYNFDYGESWNVWIGNWVGNGGMAHVYYPAGQEPYYQTFYTPVFYLFLGAAFWVFNPTILVGRLVSVSACIVSTIVVFLLVRRLTGNKWYGILGGLLFLAMPLTSVWSEFIHVDTMGVTFSLLGMYLFIRGGNTRKSLWSVLPFLLGIFTKQVFVIAPLAVCVYLLYTNRRLLLQFGTLMVVFGLALVGLFQWWSGGNFIWAILGSPRVFNVHLELSIYLTSIFFRHYPIILMLAVCVVALAFVRPKDRKEPYVLLVLYFLFSTTLAVYTCGKVGSWIGYFLEVLAVATILVPILAWKISTLPEGKPFRSGFYIGDKTFSTEISAKGILALAIPVLVLIQLASLPNYGAWTQPPGTISEDYEAVIDYIRAVPEDVPILSEDAYVQTAVGREPFWEPSYFSAGAKNKGIDQSVLVERIRNKEFGLIILEWDLTTYYNWRPILAGQVEWMSDDIRRCFSYGYMRSTDEMTDAMLENYQLKDSFTRMWIYEPIPE